MEGERDVREGVSQGAREIVRKDGSCHNLTHTYVNTHTQKDTYTQ